MKSIQPRLFSAIRVNSNQLKSIESAAGTVVSPRHPLSEEGFELVKTSDFENVNALQAKLKMKLQ